MSVGVRLVCSILMLLHIIIGILPFITGNVGTIANFFEFVFCSNTSVSKEYNFKHPLPAISLSCTPMQSILSGMCVPYCLAANLILLVSNASLLVCGWSTNWLSISYTAVHTCSAIQLVGLGGFVIFHFQDRQEVGILFIHDRLLLCFSGLLYCSVFCYLYLEHFYWQYGHKEEG